MNVITDYTVRTLPPEVLASLIFVLGGALITLLGVLYKKNKAHKKTIEDMKKVEEKKKIDCIDEKDNEQSRLIRELREDMNLKHEKNAKWQVEITAKVESIDRQQKAYQEKKDLQFKELGRKVQEMMDDLDLSKKSDMVILRDKINFLSVNLIKDIETYGASKENIDQMAIIQEMFKVYSLKGGNDGVGTVVDLAKKKLERNNKADITGKI